MALACEGHDLRTSRSPGSGRQDPFGKVVTMNSLTISAIVLTVVFAGGAVGLELQRVLPESYTTGGARDMTGAVVGLMTLLLALVLGLLIWTAYGVFSAQKLSIQILAINDLKLDAALKDYGPEAAEGRKILRAGVERTIAQTWSSAYDGDFVIKNYNFALANLKEREAYLNSLQPSMDRQKTAKADAEQAAIAIGQTRMQMALALVEPISYPLIGLVVAWATFLFCGYGLMSKRHPMSYVTLGIGALGIASAINVIDDFSDAYSGLFRISPSPIVDVLKAVEATAK
jgi:hypothetical protein